MRMMISSELRNPLDSRASMTTPINHFLIENSFDLSSNPCVSPDFCLDWTRCRSNLKEGRFTEYPKSKITLKSGATLSLIEDQENDHAWKLTDLTQFEFLSQGTQIDEVLYFPASFENLIALKNRLLEDDPRCTVFPSADERLGKQTLGIGARFTTLHWPAVEWAMAKLGIGLTANQNSVPRELVYSVDAMLNDELETVPFPFIGTDVPEGHQGQSIEGMSHGAIISKLKTGFHLHGIAWSFNADHQPIGGKFDAREDPLVEGCLFASYITFDLSPELAITKVPEDPSLRSQYINQNLPEGILASVKTCVRELGLKLDDSSFENLVCLVWPAMKKMKARDQKYAAIRRRFFTTEKGRTYLRELSIDELPGLTTPETTAIMLAFCEAMEMPVNFIAPAFGFQKNAPYPDNERLLQLIEAQWKICEKCGVSIGFHSGSGKSEANYRIMGQATGSNLEIKTSGRYTYEMGIALSQSKDPSDQALWQDWYAFTKELARQGAFSDDETERNAAREFIEESLPVEKRSPNLFSSKESCLQVLDTINPSPKHMLFFEYNFLYVLAGKGASQKSALGDHSPSGYRQRKRFYSISDGARLTYSKRVAEYIVFLAEATGLCSEATAQNALSVLKGYNTYQDLIDAIAPLPVDS
ncbi:MAG: tagaturonate epimerase family protein [Verrucomicrobiota bacterium]